MRVRVGSHARPVYGMGISNEVRERVGSHACPVYGMGTSNEGDG
jgi:hypothetical protein